MINGLMFFAFGNRYMSGKNNNEDELTRIQRFNE